MKNKVYYITFWKRALLLLSLVLTLAFSYSQTTLYTYKSGDWNDPDTWTTDASGLLLINPSSLTPGASDNVVILNSKTIDLTNDISSSQKVCDDIEIHSGGIIDIHSGITRPAFTTMRGQGRIRLSDDLFPTGTSTDFRANGTVEYYGNSFSITSQGSFYNFIVNMTSGQILTLESDLDVTNDLTISGGTFQINDNSTNDTKFTINISGDLTVESGTYFTVGQGDPIQTKMGGNYDDYTVFAVDETYYTLYHVVNCYGNITNQGTIRFTNQSQPDYLNLTNNGAVSLYLKGSSDNTLLLSGTTDLYNLVIDKGSDQTYTATINSSSDAYFRLFGANGADLQTGGSYTNANPEIRKALWIKNGTLRLRGNIFIPTLTEDHEGTSTDYIIPENGALWVDGSQVTVYSTADNNAETSVGGVQGTNVTTNDGTYYEAMRVYGLFKISEGLFSTKGSNGFPMYNYANANIIIEGGEVQTKQFGAVPGGTGTYSYYQSGGTFKVFGDIITDGGSNDFDVSAQASFGIYGTDNAFSMTGGILEIYDGTDNSADALYIESSASNNYIAGGTVKFIKDGTLGDNYSIYSTASFYNFELSVLNHTSDVNFMIEYDLTILNDITIGDYCIFDASTNDKNLTFAGDFTLGASTNSSADYLPGDGANNATTIDGSENSILTIANTSTIKPLEFFNLIIEKSADNDTVIISSASAQDTLIGISNDFTIEKGVFDYSSYIVKVNGDLVNNGTMGIESSTGKIVLYNFSAAQSITTGLGSPTFGHIEIDNLNSVTLNDNSIFNELTITNGIFDIGTNRLTLGTYLVNGSSFGSSKMIEMDISHSNRGLRYTLGDFAGSTNLDYPIGSGGFYTNARITVPAGDYTDEWVGVMTCHDYHPATSGSDRVQHYWLTTVSDGIEGTANVQQFYYSSISGGGGYKEMFSIVGSSWVEADNWDSQLEIHSGKGAITTLENLYVSGGKNASFNHVDIKYSNNAGGGNWTASGTWNPSGEPASYDFVVILSGDEVTMNAGSKTVSSIDIEEGATLDLGAYTGHTFNIVTGGGTIKARTDDLPDGDYGDFVTTSTSVVEFYDQAGDTHGVSSELYEYPTLKITGSGTVSKQMPAHGLYIYQNLQIGDATNTGVELQLAQNTEVEVEGNIEFQNQGVLTFQTDNSDVTSLIVNNNIDFGTSTSSSITLETGTSGNPNHILSVYGDITIDNSTLTLNNAGGTVDLYFMGDENSTVTGTTTPALKTIYVDKDALSDTVSIFSDFTINTDNAVQLNTGTLVLDNSGINITLTDANGDFVIPDDGAFILRNGAITSISGASTGLSLSGLLKIEDNSQMIISDGTENNFIEYSSSGNAEIQVLDNAVLTVNSKIRRSTLTTTGILKYTQSGGTVTIGKENILSNGRAVFEVLNSGSEFNHTGGTFTLSNANNGTVALYLDPASSNVAAGTTINFGDANTDASQVFQVYSTIDLQNVTLDNTSGNNPEVELSVLPLTVNTLTIGNGALFDANSLDLTINGNLINSADNANAYTPGANTTTFDGTVQTVTGDLKFYDLVFSPATSVTLSNTSTSFTVENDFAISSGNFVDNTNIILLEGDFINNGTHTSGGSNGILLQGAVSQNISGTGTYGRIEIDNSNGVFTQNNISLDNVLTMTNGNLYIQSNLLALGENNSIAGAPFSSSKMIVTNGYVGDYGVEKSFAAIANGETLSYTFPFGSNDKYTPLVVEIESADICDAGVITAQPVNGAHPTITSPESNNVLQYYWLVTATGYSGSNGFNGSLEFYYNQNDVALDGNTEADYINARLDANDQWAKGNTSFVDETNNIINFHFSGVTASELENDFTAGVETSIPDDIAVFTSLKDGDWDDVTTWSKDGGGAGVDVPAGGPNGQIIIIDTDHTVTTNGNSRLVYKSTISGILDIGVDYGHYLGKVVDGSGTIKLATGVLPAMNTEQFFKCGGGSLHYYYDASNGGNYTIASSVETVENLTFSGDGTRIIPDLDIHVCSQLAIDQATVDNETNDNAIYLKGDFVMTNNGGFDAGSGDFATLILHGDETQSITGDFTGEDALNNLEIDNVFGVDFENDIEVANKLFLTEGNINTTESKILYLSTSGESIVTGGSETSFVNGPIQKYINGGNSFDYPLGKGNRYGELNIENTATENAEIWEAEYYDESYFPDTKEASISFVSNTEYWRIEAPASGSPEAKITLTWNVSSGFYGSDDGLMIVWWDPVDGRWEEVPNGPAYTKTSNSITMSGTHDFSTYNEQYFTLATSSSDTYTWDGSTDTDWFTSTNWTPEGIPGGGDDVTIPGGLATNYPVIVGEAYCENLELQTGSPAAELTVSAGSVLMVNNDVTLGDDCQFTIKDNSSNNYGQLYVGGTFSVGSNVQCDFERYFTKITFHEVSSPVSNAPNPPAIGAIAGRNYVYNESNLSFETNNDATYEPGKGYLQYYYTNSTAIFRGSQFNLSGTYTYEIQRTVGNSGDVFYGYDVVGNPFPFSIDADDFITHNAETLGIIEGTIYIWDEQPNSITSFDYNLNYLIYNVIGGVGAGVSSQVSTKTFDGILAPTQGFEVVKLTDGTANIEFTKDMYSLSSGDDVFKSKPKYNEIQKIHLSINDEQGFFNEIIVAFKDDATKELDNLYDARKREDAPISLYSFCYDDKLAIQTQSFISNEEIRIIDLGVKVQNSGIYYFDMLSLDDLNEAQQFYLEDLKADKTIEIKELASHKIHLEKGTYDNRFRLIALPIRNTPKNFVANTNDLNTSTLINEIKTRDEITIYSFEENLIVDMGKFPLSNNSQIDIYNLLGEKISSYNILNPLVILSLGLKTGVYIVVVIDEKRVLNTGKVFIK